MTSQPTLRARPNAKFASAEDDEQDLSASFPSGAERLILVRTVAPATAAPLTLSHSQIQERFDIGIDVPTDRAPRD
jgi:hypothetical protein